MCFMFFYQCCFVYISNGVTDFLLAMIDDVITGGRSLMLRFLPGPVETGPEVNASAIVRPKLAKQILIKANKNNINYLIPLVRKMHLPMGPFRLVPEENRELNSSHQ